MSSVLSLLCLKVHAKVVHKDLGHRDFDNYQLGTRVRGVLFYGNASERLTRNKTVRW